MSRESSKKWKLNNPELNRKRNKKYCHKYYLVHKENMKKNSGKWALGHPEEAKESHRRGAHKYILTHPEYTKQWKKENPEYDKQWKKNNPEKMRKFRVKEKSKRRSFDFIPLNNWFEGGVFHHFDKVYGVYIPKEIHNSIWHSVLKNINMDKINAIAFNYIGR